MRRRRQKSTLLPKMIGVAVLVNAIVLPILAQLGAFKGVVAHYNDVRLIKLPPVEKLAEKKKEPPKRAAKAKPRPPGRKPARVASARPSRPNPNQPKVVATAGDHSGNGPAIENNGTAAPGQVTGPETQPSTAPAQTTPAAVTPPTPPAPPVEAVKPAVEPAPPPHEPVIVAAAPVYQPNPTLPDNLLESDLHASFLGLFTVHKDGTATVKMVISTGNRDLDALALQAGKRWTFRPATQDGVPVESYLRLAVEFEVS